MPLVEPRSWTEIADAAVGGLVDVELDVPAAHAGVVDAEVGLGAAPDDQARRLERVAGPVHLEVGASPAYLRMLPFGSAGGAAPHVRPSALTGILSAKDGLAASTAKAIMKANLFIGSSLWSLRSCWGGAR